jgi:ribosomal protein S18 acetylase RimI-like enzyme
MPGHHADLVSVGVSDAFGGVRADEALVEAFLRTVATQGGDMVRAIVDPRDPDSIAMLEAVGFAGDPSTDPQSRVADLWAQTS